MSDLPAATRLMVRHVEELRRQVLDDLDAVKAAITCDFGEPTPPTEDRHVDDVPGWRWTPARGWFVEVAKANGTRPGPLAMSTRFVYVHSPGESWDDDVSPITPAEARDMARVLWAAAEIADPRERP